MLTVRPPAPTQLSDSGASGDKQSMIFANCQSQYFGFGKYNIYSSPFNILQGLNIFVLYQICLMNITDDLLGYLKHRTDDISCISYLLYSILKTPRTRNNFNDEIC